MDVNETWHKYSSCEWGALLKIFSGLEVKGRGDDQTAYYNGGDVHSDGDVSARLICFLMTYVEACEC